MAAAELEPEEIAYPVRSILRRLPNATFAMAEVQRVDFEQRLVEANGLDGWLREVAPSNELRRWFGHDPARWEEFRRRYFAELEAKPEAWRPLLEAVQAGAVTLLFSARDEEHNNAVALKAFLEARLKGG